jgi:gluconolactonase
MKRLLFALSLVALGAAACGGGGSGTGAAGTSAAGTTGAAGTSGGAGTAAAAGTTGAAGTGATAGTGGGAGTTGAAGAAAGSGGGGAAGTTGGGPWRCPAGTHAAPTLTGLTPQRLAMTPPADDFAQGFSIIEGPVWLGDALYVSQFGSASRPPPSRLLKVVPGQAATVLNPDVGANGMAAGPNGDLYLAVHKDGAIRKLSLSSPATSTAVAAQYMGKRFNSPNDVAVRSDGTVYFSDPDAYQSPNPVPQAKTRVYRVSPAGEVSVVDETISQPNGVLLSLDEKTLFVSGGAGLVRFPVNPDGSTGARVAFGNGTAYTGSDGMGIDCAGNLYLTLNSAVVVLSPTGTELGRITTSAQATNVAFGGPDHKTLFITTLGSTPGVFSVDLTTPGLPN